MAENLYEFIEPSSVNMRVHGVGERVENIVADILERAGFDVLRLEEYVLRRNYVDNLNIRIPQIAIRKKRVPDFSVYRRDIGAHLLEVTGSFKYSLFDDASQYRLSRKVYIEASKHCMFSYYYPIGYDVILTHYFADGALAGVTMKELVLLSNIVTRTFFVETDNVYEKEVSFMLKTVNFKPLGVNFIESSYDIILRGTLDRGTNEFTIANTVIMQHGLPICIVDTPVKIGNVYSEYHNAPTVEFVRELADFAQYVLSDVDSTENIRLCNRVPRAFIKRSITEIVEDYKFVYENIYFNKLFYNDDSDFMYLIQLPYASILKINKRGKQYTVIGDRRVCHNNEFSFRDEINGVEVIVVNWEDMFSIVDSIVI